MPSSSSSSSSFGHLPELEDLLEYLKRSRGFDLTGYKRASLQRRIAKRMQAVRVDSYSAYRDFLEANPREVEQLFDTILINVTGFFRDPETWEYLRGEVVPKLIAQKQPRQPIRIWSAACATGEEAYTLAILFAEALGPDEFRERVKIYATDVDEAALIAARSARFAARAVEELPAEIVEKYFEVADTHVSFRKDLRRSVVFGRNDLIQDAPISRIDLLTCRNVLMYFDAATQVRIIARFFFALNEGGYLVLGKAETLVAHAHMFAPVDLKRRIFQKPARSRGAGRVLQAAARAPADHAETDMSGADLRESALRASSVAQILVDPNGVLVFANDRATGLFRLAMGAVGRPVSNLDVSYQPIELRSLIDQAYAERRLIVRTGVEWRPHGSSEVRWFDLQVIPLHGEDGTYLGSSVTFTDVTAHRQLQADFQQSENELQAAYEDLQSTNEEFQTTNEEFRQRDDELNQLNRFLEQVFTSLCSGIAVVDPDFRVIVWNRKAEDLWGVREDEAEGANFLNLDIGLPVDRLQQPIRAALARSDGGSQELVLPATNRRGKFIQCRVVCAPLMGPGGGEPQGVIVTMEEVGKGRD